MRDFFIQYTLQDVLSEMQCAAGTNVQKQVTLPPGIIFQ